MKTQLSACVDMKCAQRVCDEMSEMASYGWENDAEPGQLTQEETEKWLMNVLQKEKNRDHLAKLEEGLVHFLNDKSQSRLRVPPRNAFQRKVCRAVAVRFRLDHKLENCADATAGASVQLVLIKTPHSAVPPTLLSEMPLDQGVRDREYSAKAQPTEGAPKPATFLRRPQSDGLRQLRMSAYSLAAPSKSGKAIKSVSAEEYEEVRKRIFKNGDHCCDRTSAVDNPETQPRGGGGVAKGSENEKTGFSRRRGNVGTGVPSRAKPGPGFPLGLAAEIANTTLERESDRIGGRPNGNSALPPHDVRDPAREFSLTMSQEQSSRIRRSTWASAEPSVGVSGLESAGHLPVRSTSAVRPNNDKDDPDFDRNIDKWALRSGPTAPSGVGLFPQFSYPYGSPAANIVQAASPSLQNISLQNSAAAPQAQPQRSLVTHQVHQGHPNVMHHQASRMLGVPGMFGMPCPISQASHPAQHFHQNDLATRAASPVVAPGYGLDSVADFPPLSHTRNAERGI